MRLESLESRVLLSSVFNPDTGVLTIQGTPGRDVIQVSEKHGYLIVNFSGHITRAIRHEKVKQIDIFGGKGDDRISVGQLKQGIGKDPATGKTIYLPALLVGGDGKDTLIGGNGNDTIIGGTGGDRLTSKGGGDSDLAQAGNDNIQAGSGNDIIDPGGFVSPSTKAGQPATASAEKIDFGSDAKKTTKTLVIPDDFRPDLEGNEAARVQAYIGAAAKVKAYNPANVQVITPAQLPDLGVLPLEQTVVPTAVGFTKVDGAMALEARLPAGFQYVFGQVARQGDTFYVDTLAYATGVSVDGALSGTDFEFKLADDLKPGHKYVLRFEGPGGLEDLSPGVKLKFGFDADKKIGGIVGFAPVKVFGLPNKKGG